MLAWQDHVPRFVAKGFAGNKLIFFFGSTNIDDIAITEFHFVVQLFEHDRTWSVYTEWRQWGERNRKPNVEAFLSELNAALETHQDLDLMKYWHVWSREETYFAVVIRNTQGDSLKVA